METESPSIVEGQQPGWRGYSEEAPYSPVWTKPNSRKCVLGVCAMEKKCYSKPMTQILDRIRAYGEFVVIIFGNNCILEEPIEQWPLCDCLITFDSTGFPLEKAIAYVKLRRPFSVNDLKMQSTFRNRKQVYEMLVAADICTPRHLYLSRDPSNPAADDVLEEFSTHITVNGERLDKPFVEKPYDGDDHNVYIYYGPTMGGGSRRLFRKVKDRSSEHSLEEKLRQTGSYVYEPFLPNAMDLKVYTIGPGYAHGETRKSPALDGQVERDPDNKEVRSLTRLSVEEKEIARKICIAFKQNICGFDIIRHQGRSFVIDVNGWSFVKGNQRYYDKCARILRKMMLGCTHGKLAMRLPQPPQQLPLGVFHDKENDNILLSVVAFFRHADRTPKQKIKMKSTWPGLLDMFPKPQNPTDKVEEIKLKKSGQLRGVLLCICNLMKSCRDSLAVLLASEEDTELEQTEVEDNENKQHNDDNSNNTDSPKTEEVAESSKTTNKKKKKKRKKKKKKESRQDKLKSMRKDIRYLECIETVLLEGYGGTKVQLKPKKVEDGVVKEIQLVVKWGGEMTHTGIGQARQYSPVFWNEILRPRIHDAVCPPTEETPTHASVGDPSLKWDHGTRLGDAATDEEDKMRALNEKARQDKAKAQNNRSDPKKPSTGSKLRNHRLVCLQCGRAWSSSGELTAHQADAEHNDAIPSSKLVDVATYASPVEETVGEESLQYAQQRKAFLENIQVYASDEARVQASARAFLMASLDVADSTDYFPQTLIQSSNPTAIHRMLGSLVDNVGGSNYGVAEAVEGPLPNVVSIQCGPDVQAFLDDIPERCAKQIETAKGQVRKLVLSEKAFAKEDDLQELLLFNAQPIQPSTEDGDIAERIPSHLDFSGHSMRTSSGISAHASPSGRSPYSVSGINHRLGDSEADGSQHSRADRDEHCFVAPDQQDSRREGSDDSAGTTSAGTSASSPTFNYDGAPTPLLQQGFGRNALTELPNLARTYTDSSMADDPEWMDHPTHQSPLPFRDAGAHLSSSQSSSTLSHLPTANSVFARPLPRAMSSTDIKLNDLDTESTLSSRRSSLTSVTGGSKNGKKKKKKKVKPGHHLSEMTSWAVRCLRWVGCPRNWLVQVHDLLQNLRMYIRRKVPSSSGEKQLLCHNETFQLMRARWETLIAAFYNQETDEFDSTKIPDLADNIKYDVIHNSDFFTDLRPLYIAIKRVADFVVPQEYGVLRKDKLSIGRGMIQPLLRHITHNLEQGLQPCPKSRVALYFSSESHIHALRNVLLLSGVPSNKTVATTLEAVELNYMAHGVLRLFEDPNKRPNDPYRYYVNVMFSPGAALDPFTFTERHHVLPVSRPIPINGRIPLSTFKKLLDL